MGRCVKRGVIFVTLGQENNHMASPKSFLVPLFERAKNVTDVLILKRARAKKWQDRTLKKMLFHARNTEFGKLHQFESLLIAENTTAQFKKTVPITDYEGMHSWWPGSYSLPTNARRTNSNTAWFFL